MIGKRTTTPMTQQDAALLAADTASYVGDFDLLMERWPDIVRQFDGLFVVLADGKVKASADTVEVVRE